MISRDRDEDFDEKLAFVEYLASYINPEAVVKNKERRESTKAVPDEEFLRTIANLSGGEVAEKVKRNLAPKE